MSELLEKYALPTPSARIRNELGLLKLRYEVGKTPQKKRLVLNDLLEIYIGYFNLDYNTKIIYDNRPSDDGFFHLGELYNRDFDKASYALFCAGMKAYIDRMYTLKNNRVDDDLYTVSRLASLNSNKELLSLLFKETNKEFFGKESTLDLEKIDVISLVMKNDMRNLFVKDKMMKTGYHELDSTSMVNVYTCLSSDIFVTMNKNEKIHLCRLIDMYFQYEEGDAKKYYESKIRNDTTNVETLKIIFEHIKAKGDSAIAKKQNEDLLDNLMSGLKYSEANEIYKNKLNLIKRENILETKKR